MIGPTWTRHRLLVPRWRALKRTIAAHELASIHPESEVRGNHDQSGATDKKRIAWEIHPSVITAGEFVGSCLVEAQEGKALAAARYLSSADSTATISLRKLGAVALQRAGDRVNLPIGEVESQDCDKQTWRKRTRRYPQNSLAWVELSLLDMLNGKKEAAKRSMAVALQLAPTNRHVLRSASRLFLHLGDVDKAYDVIAKSPATASDPWLIAAELSIAELAHRKPRYFTAGRRIINKFRLSARQTTELSGAIGTLELIAGRRNKARDHFLDSVRDPTGNALAQAEWASPSFGIELVTTKHFISVPEVEEAKVFQLLRQEKFDQIPELCHSWSTSEAYSSRPYEIGSSVTAMLGNHNETIDTAIRGLSIRRDSGILLNNLAFSLAHVNQFQQADWVLEHIDQDKSLVSLAAQATRGLLEMRRGEYDRGLTFYERSISGFRQRRANRYADIACIYRAREAALASLSRAERFVRIAREAMERIKSSGHSHVLEDAERALSEMIVTGKGT